MFFSWFESILNKKNFFLAVALLKYSKYLFRGGAEFKVLEKIENIGFGG